MADEAASSGPGAFSLWGVRLMTWGLPAFVLWLATRPAVSQQAWVERFGFTANQSWVEPYRAFTGPLLHLTLSHAVVNATAWVMLCFFARRAGVFGGVMAVLLLAWPASNALLMLMPDTSVQVVGLSGPLYAFWAALAVLALPQARLRPVALLALALLVFKLWHEQAWVQPVVASLSWPFPVVQAVHFTGALSAGLLSFFIGFVSRLLSPSPPKPVPVSPALSPTPDVSAEPASS